MERILKRDFTRRRITLAVLSAVSVLLTVLAYHWVNVRSVFTLMLLLIPAELSVALPMSLIFDLIHCRYVTVQKRDHSITLCRGWFYGTVYLDGEPRTAVWLSRQYPQTVQLPLPDGPVAFIVFYSGPACLARITYSDRTSSVEV